MISNNDALEIKLLNSTDDSLKIHHLPCHIDHDGEAKVEEYFEPNIKPNSNDESILEGSFRGRPLQGKKIILSEQQETPLQVTGYIINEDKSCVHTFNDFTTWTLDQDPQYEQDIQAALDWIQFSSIIHKEIKM